jgi:hypothetical protein
LIRGIASRGSTETGCHFFRNGSVNIQQPGSWGLGAPTRADIFRDYVTLLSPGTTLERIATEANSIIPHVFFSFWRDADWRKTNENPWYHQKIKNGLAADMQVYQVERPVALLVVPYKSVSFDDPDDYDIKLKEALLPLADTDEERDAISYILDVNNQYRQASNPDFVFLNFLCKNQDKLGVDGFMRLVESPDEDAAPKAPRDTLSIQDRNIHSHDEVAVCSSALYKLILNSNIGAYSPEQMTRGVGPTVIARHTSHEAYDLHGLTSSRRPREILYGGNKREWSSAAIFINIFVLGITTLLGSAYTPFHQ